MKYEIILKLIMAANAVIDTMLSASVTFLNVALFIILTHNSKPLLPTYIVFAIGFFARLCTSIGSNFTRAINSVTNMMVSAKRIESFMLEEEMQSSRIIKESSLDDEFAVKMKNVTASWSNEKRSGIREIDLTIKKGILV